MVQPRVSQPSEPQSRPTAVESMSSRGGDRPESDVRRFAARPPLEAIIWVMQQINPRNLSHVETAGIYHLHVPDAGAELRVRLKSPRCRLGCAIAVEQEVARADEGSACQRCGTDGLTQRSASVAAPKSAPGESRWEGAD